MAPAQKDQDALLRQFREELVNEDLLHDGDSIGTDDHTLIRFLRARQFNLKQAKIMWKNCYDWRKTAEGEGLDELCRRIDPFDYPERDHVFQYWPLFFHKTDKRGRPLNIHHFGSINTTELYKGISPDRFWQAFLTTADSLTREVLPAAECAAGKPIDGTLVVVDLKGFGVGQFWQMKGLVRDSFQISQDYFPETMSQLAIVNAPSSFTAIWAAMKPWLAKETIAKVSVLGANYRDALLQLVEAEDLPKSLGGTCTCSNCGAAGDSGKDEAAVEAKGEAAEMGRCVYSSAGPWLVGRKERREAWLRGERKAITLQPGELEMFLNKANEKGDEKDAKDAGENLDGSVDNNAEPPKDQATERHNEDSSDGSSPGPATPSVDAVQQQLDQVVIKDAPIDESVDPANEKYSESRLIQTGDLHAV